MKDKAALACPYMRAGFPDRHTYLVNLAGSYGVTLRVVLGYATLLGPEEDFDALITFLEEYSYAHDRG